MLAAVREELDRIERFLMRGDQAGADLAMLLSGLRGCDIETERGHDLKSKFTTPLRGAIFPKLYELALQRDHYKYPTMHSTANIIGDFGYRCWDMRPGDELKRPEASVDGYDHFVEHIGLAIDAIERMDR